MIKISVIVAQGSWQSHLGAPRVWSKAVAQVFEAAGLKDRGSCTLMLTNDEAVEKLNLTFRKQNKPTNILSFPGGGEDLAYLGDMAMAFETCQREAALEGKSFKDHATHLLIHGLLHLLGYDHEQEGEAEEMEALEVKLLATMGIGDPYEIP